MELERVDRHFAPTEDFYREVLDNLHDGLYFVNRNRVLTFWNQGAERLTGYGREDVLGRCCAEQLLEHVNGQGDLLCHDSCPLTQAIEHGTCAQGDVFLRHKNGHRVPVQVRAAPLRDDAGEIIGAVEIFNDNSEKQIALRRLRELEEESYRDPLTDVSNRRHGEMLLERAHHTYQWYGEPYGLLFFDIDHFKRINDAYGHDAGDKVLRGMSKTLDNALRGDDALIRWGGEEFLAIVDVDTPGQLLEIAERCRFLVGRNRIDHEDEPLHVTISIGGTMVRPDDTREDVVNRADDLLYHSKESGRDRVTIDEHEANGG